MSSWRDRPSRSSVLDPGIGKVHVLVAVRQVVLTSPSRDLFRFAIRPTVAVLSASIALVQEPLIVPLELVVQDHSPDSAALLSEALLGALVGAIDLGVMRQLAGLPDAGVEGLTRLVETAVALIPVRFEKIAPAVCQRDSSILCA